MHHRAGKRTELHFVVGTHWDGFLDAKEMHSGCHFERHLKKQTIIKINKFKVLFKLCFLCFASKDLYYSSSPPSAFLKYIFIYFLGCMLLLLFWKSHLVTSKLVHFFSTHNKTHEGTHKRMNQKKINQYQNQRYFFFVGFFWEIQVKMCNEQKKPQTATRSVFFVAAVVVVVFIYFIWNAI